MGFWKTAYYWIFGKKISKNKDVPAIRLENKITKLSKVYVEVNAVAELKDSYDVSTYVQVGKKKKFNTKTGKDAFSRIQEYVCKIDDFDWIHTYAKYTQRRIKRKNKNLIDIVIYSTQATFNIQTEGTIEEVTISS